MRTLEFPWQISASVGCFQKPRQQSIVVGFSNLPEVELNLSAALRGTLPDDLNAAIEEIGIVHPLIYQGRTQI